MPLELSVPHCCAPPTPPPPPPARSPEAVELEGSPAWPRCTEFVVVPRSTELQVAEDELGLVLVAVVGGTRPLVLLAMHYQFPFNHFGVAGEDAEVHRHDPEDFVVRFRRREDRDRVLSTPAVWA